MYRGLPILLSLLLLASCHSTQQAGRESLKHSQGEALTTHPIGTAKDPSPREMRQEMTVAAEKLGLHPERTDNPHLFKECASWLGTPYRYAGNTREGVDCSGLTLQIYKTVYGKALHRSSRDQYEKDARLIPRKKLQQGDLVFFTSPKSGGRCGHVGIYLRDGYFLHASSSRGVVVDNLDGSYYQRHFLSAGTIPDDDIHEDTSQTLK